LDILLEIKPGSVEANTRPIQHFAAAQTTSGGANSGILMPKRRLGGNSALTSAQKNC